MADVGQLIELARARREQYEQYEPRFWHPTRDAEARQREFLVNLLDDEGTAVLVAEDESRIAGFAIARIVTAPPVYDPGGPTCLVDDFTVSAGRDWPQIGPALLDALRCWAGEQGAAQIVVVTAHLDAAKRSVLRRADLSLASEWWVESLIKATSHEPHPAP